MIEKIEIQVEIDMEFLNKHEAKFLHDIIEKNLQEWMNTIRISRDHELRMHIIKAKSISDLF